jgi:Tol biopolymer transport system component
MNADGSGQVRLTSNLADDRQARWSPDGRRIVFQSMRNQNSFGGLLTSSIYVMDTNGQNTTRLTTQPWPDTTPRYSPDGTTIVYVSRTGTAAGVGPGTLKLVNADGSNPRTAAATAEIAARLADVGNPSWSPDGAWIYFDGQIDARTYGVMALSADGRILKEITPRTVRAFYPTVSPGGRHLAFGAAVGPDGTMLEAERTDEQWAFSSPTWTAPHRRRWRNLRDSS